MSVTGSVFIPCSAVIIFIKAFINIMYYMHSSLHLALKQIQMMFKITGQQPVKKTQPPTQTNPTKIFGKLQSPA